MLAAASCSAKKLMACVRPGVEETCACFDPTSAFSRLDLPTLERPRKATSGTVGGGKWSGDRAERRNFGMRRIALDCRRWDLGVVFLNARSLPDSADVEDVQHGVVAEHR